MYELHVKQCEENKEQPVTRKTYHDIFVSEYNIRFHFPRSDTCDKCDKFLAQIQSTDSERQRTLLTQERDLHVRKAENGFASLKHDTANSKLGESNADVITFDLQQTLPLPNISTGIAFYCRQLWLYNLGIHICKTDYAYMMTWVEGQARRGSDEVCSCLLKAFEQLERSDNLIAYSDGCGGQNKNWTLIMFWHFVIKKGFYKSVDHKFMVSGHSYLPYDRDFALIEKAKRRHDSLFLPSDYHDMMKTARPNRPFYVEEIKKRISKTSKKLSAKKINKSTKYADGQKVEIRNIHWIHIDKDKPYTVMVCYTHNELESWKIISLHKKGKETNITLKNKYTKSEPIKSAKLNDLKKLMEYIPRRCHSFYTGLKSTPDDVALEDNESDMDVYASDISGYDSD